MWKLFGAVVGTAGALTGIVGLAAALAGILGVNFLTWLATGEGMLFSWNKLFDSLWGIVFDTTDVLSGFLDMAGDLSEHLGIRDEIEFLFIDPLQKALDLMGKMRDFAEDILFNMIFRDMHQTGSDGGGTSSGPFSAGNGLFNSGVGGGGGGVEPQVVGQFVPVRLTNQGAQVRRVEVDIRADGDTENEREAGRKAAEAMKKELEREQAVKVEGAK